MPLQSILEDNARKSPDREALVTREGRLTYGQLDAKASHIAGVLADGGLKKGDRVCIFMENSADLVASFFGVLKAGGVAAVLNSSTKAPKLEFLLNDCGASALICSSEKAGVLCGVSGPLPHLNRLYVTGSPSKLQSGLKHRTVFLNETMESFYQAPKPAVSDADIACIIYTSGSTGRAKGVTMAHSNMLAAATAINSYLGNTSDDVILNTLPMSFDYGLYQIILGFQAGAKVVLEKFLYSYDVVSTIAREKVTGLPIVPTIAVILMETSDFKGLNFESLRYITNTGAPLPSSHIERLQGIFPKTKIFSMYGLTECKRVSYLPPEEISRRPLSVGRPMPNTTVYIIDENGDRVGPGVIGELVVQGPTLMQGYWGLPVETGKVLRAGDDGRPALYTGDLFRMDEDGYLYFNGRKDDIIKCRGEKVSPKEIEEVICKLDGVEQAAVVPVPDPVLGNAIKSYVVLRKGASLTERDVIKHCSRYLEDFIVPKHVEFRKELPKNDNGKVRKKALSQAH